MIGSLISAGASLAGGFMNKSENEKNRNFQAEQAAKQEALQREFAQSSVQWKTADALKAGIHPLYALGAPTTSYSPVTVGSSPDTSMGSAVASAGQDIGRALNAAQSQPTRDAAYTKTVQDLTIQKFGLENELLASQIAKMRSQIGPPMPTLNGKTLIDGQPATALTTSAGAPVKADDIKQQADTIPATNRIRPGGLRLYTAPWSSDAEDIETRYGDIAQEVGGAANLLSDLGYTIHKMWPRNENGGYTIPRYLRTTAPRRTGRTRGNF